MDLRLLNDCSSYDCGTFRRCSMYRTLAEVFISPGLHCSTIWISVRPASSNNRYCVPENYYAFNHFPVTNANFNKLSRSGHQTEDQERKHSNHSNSSGYCDSIHGLYVTKSNCLGTFRFWRCLVRWAYKSFLDMRRSFVIPSRMREPDCIWFFNRTVSSRVCSIFSIHLLLQRKTLSPSQPF